MSKIGIIGAGAWGTSLATVMRRAGNGVWFWPGQTEHARLGPHAAPEYPDAPVNVQSGIIRCRHPPPNKTPKLQNRAE